MNVEQVLTQVLEAGGRLIPDPQRPRLLVPPALKPLVAEHREAIRALLRVAPVEEAATKEFLRRVAIMRDQAKNPGPSPILALPDRKEGDGCLSCGAPVRTAEFRCELCALVVHLVLDKTP